MKKRIITILSAAILAVMLTACGSSVDTSQTSTSTQKPVASSEQGSGVVQTEDTAASAVDAITRKARDTANTATDDEVSEAYTYIKTNYADCFKDTETMEQMMYAGWLLEYKYEGNAEKQAYHDLGQSAEQLVKYVYRGADTADSDNTQASKEQIQAFLDEIEQATVEPAETQVNDSSNTDHTDASASSDQEASRTVYYTKSGKKYHYANPCGRGTYYPCTLAEAQSRGLEPCGKCVLR